MMLENPQQDMVPRRTPNFSRSSNTHKEGAQRSRHRHQQQKLQAPVAGPIRPAPAYKAINAVCDKKDDGPGARCGHTLTAIAAVGEKGTPGYVGPRLILFGGATTVEGNSSLAGIEELSFVFFDMGMLPKGPVSEDGPQNAPAGAGIRLAGATTDVHCFDVQTSKWSRLTPIGDPPSPRSAHAATAMGTMVIIHGGIGPAGLSTDDLHVLDLTQAKPRWHRVTVQGAGPGPRYGHVMSCVEKRFLLSIGGNDGKGPLADVWALDTAAKPYEWRKLDPDGHSPPPCMYATACARADGLLLLYGGRDASSMPLDGAYGLAKHGDGRWEWTVAPGISPSARYQHAAVFVKTRLHVSGGALGGGRIVEVASSLAVLDTVAGVWCDRKGLVTSPRVGEITNYASGGEDSNELTKRCRHAAAGVGDRIFIYGGLNGGVLLDDLLVAEDLAPGEDSERGLFRSERRGVESLVEASTAEAEAISAALAATKAPPEQNRQIEKHSPDRDPGAEATSTNKPLSASTSALIALNKASNANTFRQAPPTGVRLHHRAVVTAAEFGGALGGSVRQLLIDQFENEGRRVGYRTPYSTSQARPILDRQMSISGVQKKILNYLLKPRDWKPPVTRQFFMDRNEIDDLCNMAERLFAQESSVLQIRAPVKIFGDLHGQYGDLMRLFNEYGSPSTAGDIGCIDYLFLGDYVDRGQHSLETITLLLALKVEYPTNVHLIRGNHEASDINALFGFRSECIKRMGERDGIWAWHRINQLFNWLPLAALIERKIICMHGGIGRTINYVHQIEALQRPVTMEAGSVVLMDLLWSDPTENDSVEGLRPNARGPGLVTFGPDRVMEFCENNDLQLIVRAHECVMDGFERFAQGSANNAGAILVLGRDLVVVPKLIHPLPPPVTSSELSAERHHEDTWMQELNVHRPPTPTRGRPQPPNGQGLLCLD